MDHLLPKAVLAAKLLAIESQLAVCKHQIGQRKRPRPRFTAGFRVLWVVLSKSLDKWEDRVLSARLHEMIHFRWYRRLRPANSA